MSAGRVSDSELDALEAAGLVRKPRYASAEWCDLVRDRRAHEAAVLAEHRRSCGVCRLPLPWVFTKKGLRAETQAEVER